MTTQSNENAHPVFLGAPQIADSERLKVGFVCQHDPTQIGQFGV